MTLSTIAQMLHFALIEKAKLDDIKKCAKAVKKKRKPFTVFDQLAFNYTTFSTEL